MNYVIRYRRVDHTKEPVINDKVYAELVGTKETSRTPSACIDGHIILAGLSGMRGFISFDGETVAKKPRFY